MDLDSLAKLGEFVGGFFVVISLIYLAHQVRQNTRSLRTENYARVLDRMSTVQSQLSIDADLNRIVTIGAEDPDRLTRSERVRFSWAMYKLFGAAEFMYLQAQDHALPEAVWDRWQESLVWWLSHPGMRSWWAAKPAAMASNFEDFVQELLQSRTVDARVLARWHNFVAGDSTALETAANA